MNISIFGLGYVGSVSLGCFAKMNHKVIGVDKNKAKVDLINKGKPTIKEPGLDKLIKNGYAKKIISATLDYKTAIQKTDITFVCIGTPGNKNGNLNLVSLLNAIKQISIGLKEKTHFHTIVVRSTLLPGSYKKIVDLVKKYSGKKNLIDFCVIVNPEFLREGSAVNDFFNPPINIIGSKCKKGISVLLNVYKNNKSKVRIVNENVAEIIKLASNSFHSVKISFANEIGNLCKLLGVDSNLLMKIFCEDEKLNISSVYLKPGFAFGGSCLPKDVSAISKIAGINKLKIPLISNVKLSNNLQIKKTIELIKSFSEKKISVWGLSFKNGTDDMRGSPIIKVINSLINDKYDVKAFDQNVNLKELIGSNKEYVDSNFSRINKVLVKDFKVFLNHSKVLVINSYDTVLVKEIEKLNNKIIIDLVYVPELKKMENYQGICW
jgi:GDP-mannose 6-dehydrogenase